MSRSPKHHHEHAGQLGRSLTFAAANTTDWIASRSTPAGTLKSALSSTDGSAGK